MASSLPTPDSATATPAPGSTPRSRRWLFVVIGVLIVGALAVITFRFREPIANALAAQSRTGASKPTESVSVIGKDLVSIASGTPLEHRLHIEAVHIEDLEYPVLNATGFVMARLADGTEKAESRWDFASPDVATAYGDWLKARADVLLFEEQLKNTRELVTIKIDYTKKELDRKEMLYPTGAVPERDMVAAKTDYLQAKIQGQKDLTEAQTSLRNAERNRALLERQLLQAGVDAEVVRKATEGLVLVVADVPEAKVGLVKVGQACEARFFGVPNQVFHGKVGRLGPSVSKEKRTLRVTFELSNPSGKLLPGMFAEIGLGAEVRHVLTVPADAVLHAGTADYVMKEESHGVFRAVKITADEPRHVSHKHAVSGANGSCIPVLDGLHEGDRVVGSGAILLKPIMVKALAN